MLKANIEFAQPIDNIKIKIEGWIHSSTGSEVRIVVFSPTMCVIPTECTRFHRQDVDAIFGASKAGPCGFSLFLDRRYDSVNIVFSDGQKSVKQKVQLPDLITNYLKRLEEENRRLQETVHIQKQQIQTMAELPEVVFGKRLKQFRLILNHHFPCLYNFTKALLFLGGMRRKQSITALIQCWHSYSNHYQLAQAKNAVEKYWYAPLFHLGNDVLKPILRKRLTHRSLNVFFTRQGIVPYRSFYQDNEDFSGRQTDIKAVAFYLPQFHRIPENDRWWGAGFTEWTNTIKARPRFPGHYQPREPHDDIGYYDLSNWHVIQQQAQLARQHGIYGFCFYHYWFSGKRLLQKPLDLLVEHPEIDINFCVCWANENWTRNWDGRQGEILISQKHCDDDCNFIVDLAKYLHDPRYIRIDGKPVVLVYRPRVLPNPNRTFARWREWARTHNLGEILIWGVRGTWMSNTTLGLESCLDAEVEFPPALVAPTQLVSCKHVGNIYDYGALVENILQGNAIAAQLSFPIYRTAMMGWDNSARKIHYSDCWTGFTPYYYYQWLCSNIRFTRNHFPISQRFIFINAWNEWGEGTYLEPDKKYGYTNINATSRAIFDQPWEGDDFDRSQLDQIIKLKSFTDPELALQPLFPKNIPDRTSVTIDLIIPVYDGIELVSSLLPNIKATADLPFRCFIIDDASPDQRIKTYCQTFCRENSNFKYFRKPQNEGFINAINMGLKKCNNHVVLVNTDVVLPSGWLSRLVAPILAQPEKVASATPFTNSGTICSFPVFNHDNELLPGFDLEIIDGAFKQLNPHYIPIPTGVGFCMALNRNVLAAIGSFHTVFGRGYCEENDWCQRAISNGYENVMVPNLFVYHKHGATFNRVEKERLLKNNLAILSHRWPDYFHSVNTFLRIDPARLYRLRVLLVLLLSRCASSKIIVDYSLGGGTKLYCHKLVAAQKSDCLVIFWEFIHNAPILTISCAGRKYVYELNSDAEVFAMIGNLPIRQFYCSSIVYAHTPLSWLEQLRQYLRKSHAELIIQCHDYFLICPSYNLLNSEGNFCQLDTTQCSHCSTAAHSFPAWDGNAWRTAWMQTIELASEVTVFSSASAELVRQIYPGAAGKLRIVPHDTSYCEHFSAIKIKQPDRLHIVTLGAINVAKGAEVICRLGQYIHDTKQDARISVIGNMHPRNANVNILGEYCIPDIPDIIAELGGNLFIIASIWPETFCFTATELLALEVPIVCFDLGAPAERIRQYSRGLVLPLEYSCHPDRLYDALKKFYQKIYFTI